VKGRDIDRDRRALVPATLRRALPLITGLTVLWVGALGLLVAGRIGPLGPDRPIDRYLINLRFHGLNRPASAIAALDTPAHVVFLSVVGLILCVAIRSARTAVTVAGSVAVDLVAVEVIKELVRRRQLLPGYTYPSGHVATAAVIATVIVLACRRDGPAGRYVGRLRRVAFTVLGVLIVVVVAASMIIIQDHYFTDTIAAAPLGATVTLLVASVVDTQARRYLTRSGSRSAGASPPR
jgi:membrane-associated phospholipid phosphatase